MGMWLRLEQFHWQNRKKERKKITFSELDGNDSITLTLDGKNKTKQIIKIETAAFPVGIQLESDF